MHEIDNGWFLVEIMIISRHTSAFDGSDPPSLSTPTKKSRLGHFLEKTQNILKILCHVLFSK